MQQRHHHKKGFELLRSNSETIAHKTRMGFSLVEAAIVLAVVGGVVGAIWVAAATVIENHRVNKTVEQSLMIYQCVKNGFPRLKCDGTNICLSGSLTNWRTQTNVVGNFGCIPEDVQRSGTSPTLYYDMFGKELFVIFDDAGDGSARMLIRIGTWPAQSNPIGLCAKLANRIANLANTNDIWDIQTGIHTNPNFLSLGINEWITKCENSESQSISIKFNPA